MQRIYARKRGAANRWISLAVWLSAASATGFAGAAPYVEFDFAPIAECRDVTPPEFSELSGRPKLIEVTMPVSVRFRGVKMEDVDELSIEINGAPAGMRVYDFSPTTQLASDIAQPIETTTTTKRARSLDATLGGELPVPYGDFVAHVSPSLSGGISGSETATEKMNRLPPKQAIVVSGTSSEGRGVFFKLKRSSQTSLEGVHVLIITFVVPPTWRLGDVQVSCSAHGRRKVLWMNQSASLGGETGRVRIYSGGQPPAYTVAKPVVAESAFEAGPKSLLTAAAAGVAELVGGGESAGGVADEATKVEAAE